MDECKPLKHGLALPVVAIAFALMPAVVEKAAVGVKSAEEVRMNVEWLAAAAAVPAELWAEAKQLGLLAERVPVPTATTAPTAVMAGS